MTDDAVVSPSSLGGLSVSEAKALLAVAPKFSAMPVV